MVNRSLKWLAVAFAILMVLLIIVVNITNWNWFRQPLSRYVAEKTGRTLHLGGDLTVQLGWPETRIRTTALTFSNPAWAQEKNMVKVGAVSLRLQMPKLLGRKIVLSEVALAQGDINFEKSREGRKNWLLDRNQRNEESTLRINKLTITDGKVSYLDPAKKTKIRAQLATVAHSQDPAAAFVFKAEGRYEGQALEAHGSGGGLLTLRDQTTPYPLKITGSIGPIAVSAHGVITNLLQFSALDLQIDVRGDSLAQLYPLVGVVLPDTPPYRTRGRLIREARLWRYENFSGQIGKSDIAGSMTVDTGRPRPLLTGALRLKKLNFADLGPLVGTQSGASEPKQGGSSSGRVLPDTPFRTGRWNRMDADVTFKAGSIVRNKALPINDLTTHLKLRNALLTLDPLEFGVAGGTLGGTVRMDGRNNPIQGKLDLKARKIRLSQLFPTLDLTKTSLGLINGDIDLNGRGDTVASMLGSADGRFALVVNGGEISKLMMEAVGVHLLEILQLTLTGDKTIRIHCGIADMDVKKGVMRSRVLLLDTDVTHINATGSIDLAQEKLDLTLTQKTKKLSLVSLRPPIHVRGTFANPEVGVDKVKLATRGLGAVALGIVNPLLALLPLVETASGKDSDCGALIRQTQAPVPKTSRSKDSRPKEVSR